jgi:hypothetical protein
LPFSRQETKRPLRLGLRWQNADSTLIICKQRDGGEFYDDA